MRDSKFSYRLIQIMFFIRYLGDAFFYSFYSLYLYDIGLKESKIGIILSLTPIIALIVNPIWNIISKTQKRNMLIMRILTIIEGSFIIYYAHLTGFKLILVMTATLSIVASPFYSLMDGYAGTFASENKKSYASIRMMGSLAYVFGTSIGGIMIDKAGFMWLFLFSGILFMLVSVILFFLPIPKSEKEEKERNYKAVLTNKRFYLYMVFYVFTVTISVFGDNFFGLYLKGERGISTTNYGFIQSGIIVAEVLTMLVHTKLDGKFKDRTLYIFAGLVYALRLLLIGLDLPLYFVIPASFLRGVAWGTILSIHVKHLIKVLGVENLTAGIFILALLTNSLLSLGNIICGNIIEKFSYSTYYMTLSFIVIATTFVYIVFTHFKKEYQN